MKRSRLSEAERLRRHNDEMRYAMAHGLSLAAARYQLFRERMERLDREREQRLAELDGENRRRRNERLCGTAASESAAPHYWWKDQ